MAIASPLKKKESNTMLGKSFDRLFIAFLILSLLFTASLLWYVYTVKYAPYAMGVLVALIVTLLSVLVLMVRLMVQNRIASERLLAHFRISQDGFAIFNSDRRLVFANDLFRRYIDFISLKHLSDTHEILSQPEFHRISEFTDKEVKGREEYLDDTIERDGRTFSLKCVRFADGSFELCINDVTRFEEQALLKQQLTQNVAHEFKTPVCSIQGYLDIIKANYPDNLTPEQMQHFIDRCHSQSVRLGNLVQDMSQLTYLSGTSQKMVQERVDIALLLHDMVQEVSDRIQRANMKVDCHIAERLSVTGDPSLLYSVFRNLFDNAIAYAGEGSTIRVRCFRSDDRFHYFSFSDNGVGVSEEHLSRIFERFYRIDKGRSRKLGGTGLGLAIVKNVIVLYQGSIYARQADGGGLEFVFTLPRF